MKKRIFMIVSCLTSFVTFSQQNVTGTPPAENTNARALAAWYRGGNLNNSSSNNIFGTLWNSPIYTKTDNIQRQILMGTSPAGSITGAFGLGTISTTLCLLVEAANFFHSANKTKSVK